MQNHTSLSKIERD